MTDHPARLDDTIMLVRDTYTETRCQKNSNLFFREEQNFENARRLRAFQQKTISACADLKRICGGVLK
jgi:hypothetical protein